MTTQSELRALADRRMTRCYSPFPFVVARGQGTRLWDLEGHEYLDFTTGIAVNAVGHSHPRVVKAVAEQAAAFMHTANIFLHGPHIEMCDRLAQLCCMDRVFLANSGTEAMEAALKLARRWFFDRGEQRTEVVATQGSFHGRSFGALSITGQDTYRKGFEPFLPTAHLVPYGDLEALRAVVGPRTAAVVLEPVQGNSGVVVPPAGYLPAVRELCTKAGALLVLDEIQTGIGRTGRWLAAEHEGVVPDVFTLAKAIGGGLPLGAMVTTEAIGATFGPNVHGTTFGGNPVACAAGLATLAVISDEKLVGRAATAGERFMGALRGLASTRPIIRQVRGRGLMVGVVLAEPAKPRQDALTRAGLLVTTSGQNVLRLLPPLTVSDAELERAVALIADALK